MSPRRFQCHHQVLGLGATHWEISDARKWFRRNRDGQVTTYQSIPLLSKYRDLQWDPVAANTKTVAAAVAPLELEDCPAGSEMYCISKKTFAILLNQNSKGPTDDDDYQSNNGAVTTGDTDGHDLEAAMARMLLSENH
ncbi:MAG: hypothetical protein LQ350_003277 [Teloschistes chrysophthalmus]|nr:MAG: hypothetical protein LQ350_003277 [Niorma chrysophthalma]